MTVHPLGLLRVFGVEYTVLIVPWSSHPQPPPRTLSPVLQAAVVLEGPFQAVVGRVGDGAGRTHRVYATAP